MTRKDILQLTFLALAIIAAGALNYIIWRLGHPDAPWWAYLRGLWA